MNFVENDLKLKILRKYWGYKEFRESQEEIIENVLQKKDLFNSILKKMIKVELVLVNDRNQIYLSS